jgi:hypothetical protein
MHIIRLICILILLIYGYLIDIYVNLGHHLYFLPIPGRPYIRVIFGIRYKYATYFEIVQLAATLPKGKLACGSPRKGSPENSPEVPDSASIQHLSGQI